MEHINLTHINLAHTGLQDMDAFDFRLALVGCFALAKIAWFRVCSCVPPDNPKRRSALDGIALILTKFVSFFTARTQMPFFLS